MKHLSRHRIRVAVGFLAASCASCSRSAPQGPGAGGSGAAGGATGGTGGASAGAGGTTGSGGTAGGGGGGGGGGAGGASGMGGATSTGGSTGTGGAPPPCPSPPATYANLFVDVLGQTSAAVDAKINAAFQQLFHDTTNNVYYTVGTDQAYILDVADNDVRSEGMSYGMMIAVQLDKQDEFNRLWTFAKAHMAQPSGLFAWHVTAAGDVLSTTPAPDGDEYFATALWFASKRWGDGAGNFVYSTEARNLMDAMANQGEFDKTYNLVNFGPGPTGRTFTDASYVLPAFYEVWACTDTKNWAFWQSVIPASRAFFQSATNATTGLAPDHSSFTGAPQGNFMADAWRVAVNVMMDHYLFNADPWQTTFAARLGAFWKSQGVYGDQYTPDGTKVRADHSLGLVASNATLGFALPAADARPFLQDLWAMATPTGTFRYYDGMLYLLAMLHVSGKFHIWF